MMIIEMPLALGYVLLKKAKEEETKTKGGLILPEGEQGDTNIAIYVNHNLPPIVYKESPIFQAKTGETKVVFNSFKSIFVNAEEEEFIYVKINHILGTINEIELISETNSTNEDKK